MHCDELPSVSRLWRSGRTGAFGLSGDRIGARCPCCRRRQRHPRRSRRFIDAARSRGTRIQLPARRAIGHAHGSQPGPTAADLIATVDETDLANVIFQHGEERYSRRVARAIVQARDRAPLVTTAALADVVRRAGDPRLSAHRSCDAHLPGVEDLGESGARGSRRFSARRRGVCSPAPGSR